MERSGNIQNESYACLLIHTKTPPATFLYSTHVPVLHVFFILTRTKYCINVFIGKCTSFTFDALALLCRYSGEWFEGRPHGRGTKYAADGSVLKDGRWEHGAFKGALDPPAE